HDDQVHQSLCCKCCHGFLVFTILQRRSEKLIMENRGVNENFDPFSMFNPELSDALRIIQIHQTTNGATFGEFLINQNCKFEVLESFMHGGFLLHIQKGGDIAYAKVTDTTEDNVQRFTSSLGLMPEDEHLWDIEIAFPEFMSLAVIAVERAALEMKSHFTCQSAIGIKVKTYQQLSAFEKYVDDLHHFTNLRLKSIGYNDGWLEIQTIHNWSDESNIECSRTFSIFGSVKGQLNACHDGINENHTVDLPHLPITYQKLPFVACRLIDIEISQDEGLAAVLYLTISEILEGQQGKKIILAIEMDSNYLKFNEITTLPPNAISTREYVRKQSSYDLEILHDHPTSDEIEALIDSGRLHRALNWPDKIGFNGVRMKSGQL
ncbi:MAG: hypothetical protein JZU65_08260, partial [Chlorobium sp.]|nr:hypothetical protein [Chlorobium sp.]